MVEDTPENMSSTTALGQKSDIEDTFIAHQRMVAMPVQAHRNRRTALGRTAEGCVAETSRY